MCSGAPGGAASLASSAGGTCSGGSAFQLTESAVGFCLPGLRFEESCARATPALNKSPQINRTGNGTGTPQARGPKEAGASTISSSSDLAVWRVSQIETTGNSFESKVYSSRKAAKAAAVIDHSTQIGRASC